MWRLVVDNQKATSTCFVRIVQMVRQRQKKGDALPSANVVTRRSIPVD